MNKYVSWLFVVLAFILLAGCAVPKTVDVSSSIDRVSFTVPRYEGGLSEPCVEVPLLQGDVVHGVEIELPYDYKAMTDFTHNGGNLCFKLEIPSFLSTEEILLGSVNIYQLAAYEFLDSLDSASAAFIETVKVPFQLKTVTYEKPLPQDRKVDQRFRPNGMSSKDYNQLYRELDSMPAKVRDLLSAETSYWLAHHDPPSEAKIRLESVRAIIEKEPIQ